MLDRTYIFYPSHCKLLIFLSPNFLHVRELLSKLFWYNRPSQNIKYTIRSNKVNIVGVKHLIYFTSVVSGSFVLRSRMLIVVFPFGCLILRNVKSVAECCNDINHFGCWQEILVQILTWFCHAFYSKKHLQSSVFFLYFMVCPNWCKWYLRICNAETPFSHHVSSSFTIFSQFKHLREIYMGHSYIICHVECKEIRI